MIISLDLETKTYVSCIDDQKTERCRFLWLRTRKVKDPRLTSGKTYPVMAILTSTYGNKFVNYDLVHYLIKDDTGTLQYFPQERFVQV